MSQNTDAIAGRKECLADLGVIEAILPAAKAASRLRACGILLVADEVTLAALNGLASAGNSDAALVAANLTSRTLMAKPSKGKPMNRVGAVKQHITGLTIAAALIVVAGITSWLSGASESAAQVVGIGAVILSGLALLIWGIDPIFKLPDDSFGQPKE